MAKKFPVVAETKQQQAEVAAYEGSMGQGDTTMVLSPDSAFFRYFQNGPQAR